MVRKFLKKLLNKVLSIFIYIYSLNYILFTAPSEAIIQLAIEHIYPLVLPFKLTNLLDDKCLVRVIGGTKSQEQNTGILESWPFSHKSSSRRISD